MIGGSITARSSSISATVAARSSSIGGTIRAAGKGFAPPAPSGRVTGVPPLSFTAPAGSLTDYRINGNTSGSSGVGDLSGSSYNIPITLNSTTKNIALSMPLYAGDWVSKKVRHNYFTITNTPNGNYPSGMTSSTHDGDRWLPRSRWGLDFQKLLGSSLQINTFATWSNTAVNWDKWLYGPYYDGTSYNIPDGIYKLRVTVTVPPRTGSSLSVDSTAYRISVITITTDGTFTHTLTFSSSTPEMQETEIEISDSCPLTGVLLRINSTVANETICFSGTTVSVGIFDSDDIKTDVSPSGDTNVTSYFRKVTYTGASSEEWEYYSGGRFIAGTQTAANNKVVLAKPKGIMLLNTDVFSKAYVNEQMILYLVNESITSLSDFQSYLSSNPLTVIYETATPYGESPEMPVLTAAEGSNTLSIGTNVQPSSVTLIGEGIQS